MDSQPVLQAALEVILCVLDWEQPPLYAESSLQSWRPSRQSMQDAQLQKIIHFLLEILQLNHMKHCM